MSSSLFFIPDDLISEVLSLLNVKSILRFRCVSKFWDTLITDPIFVNLHLKKSEKLNPHVILTSWHTKTITPYGSDHDGEYTGESPYGSDDDGEYTGESPYGSDNDVHGVIPHSISSILENPWFTLYVDSDYLVEDKGCSSMVGSCNGLICLDGLTGTREYYEYWFRLWNPATRTTSPKFGFLRLFHNRPHYTSSYSDDGFYKFTFGCDDSTGTYKLVASRHNYSELRSNVRILSLGDNVWREIQSFPVDPLCLRLRGETGVSFKSTINWLAVHNTVWYIGDDYKDITIDQFLIVSLDLSTETYNQYLLPPDFDQVPPQPPIIGVLGDRLFFSSRYNETDFIIWQMEKFGVEDSWTQFLKISCHSLQIDYDYSEHMKHFFELIPLFLSKDGDTLILKCTQEDQEILYNWRNNTVVRTNITATTTTTDDETSNSASYSANGYFESLVSVFGVIKRTANN
ncbi:F-box/kelch-repeat protein At3g23880-like [Vicia villosa]|uniref:F-box/kelch-repeat protein At3g23880-like n=1 Tax=Vicia villosa TaxID=3911 RepID=UPI00273C75BD|nr:F-box/kelch-repeat protein At3g23880-like [Vicia villosa]